MSKKRLLLVILLIILIAVAGFFVYVTSPTWLPQGTTIQISPAQGAAKSGENMVFIATVKAGSTEVAGGTITWSVTVGSLNKNTGTTIVFTAPSVATNTSVTISASFSGIGVYQASSGTVRVMVYNKTSPGGGQTTTTTTTTQTTTQASPILPYLYTLSFEGASMTNLKFLGPVVMNGTDVTMITADRSDMTGFKLSHFGLSASEMIMNSMILYTTNLKLLSSGGTLMVINGSETINSGPSSATFGNSTLYLARMEASTAQINGVTALGEQVGGSEPYVPSILSAPSVAMTNTYSVTGPVTYGALISKATNITVGELQIQQFSFAHPSAYTLDRITKTYTSTDTWLLKASSATATNVVAYLVYFKVTAMGIDLTAVGGDNMIDIIPGGLNVGGSFTSGSTVVQPVYLQAGSMSLNDLVLSIEA
jgi:hypothetical protein